MLQINIHFVVYRDLHLLSYKPPKLLSIQSASGAYCYKVHSFPGLCIYLYEACVSPLQCANVSCYSSLAFQWISSSMQFDVSVLNENAFCLIFSKDIKLSTSSIYHSKKIFTHVHVFSQCYLQSLASFLQLWMLTIEKVLLKV